MEISYSKIAKLQETIDVHVMKIIMCKNKMETYKTVVLEIKRKNDQCLEVYLSIMQSQLEDMAHECEIAMRNISINLQQMAVSEQVVGA